MENKTDKPIYKLEINEFDYKIYDEELFLIGDSLLDQKGLVSHHLESANNLYKTGLEQIITQGFKVERDVVNKRTTTDEDKQIDWIHVEVNFSNVNLSPPTTLNYQTGKPMVLYPRVALIREKVYSGNLSVSCEITATAHFKNGSKVERKDVINNFRICKVPIIKGSIMCHTYGKSAEALSKIGEDPSDPGGYFIIQGNEYVAECIENVVMNQPKIFINKSYGNSLIRCEFISKPGDSYQNSDQILVNYFNNNNIIIEIARNELKGIQIPFYLVFRALGWTNDKEIINNIVYDYDNEGNKDILNIIISAMNAKYEKFPNAKSIYTQVDALKTIFNALPGERYEYLDLKNKPENYQQVLKDVILKTFDLYCLPHIGKAPINRYEKLRFIGLLIRKTLQCHLGQIPQTDRDSYKIKRIYAAGDNYAKAIKTYFNQTVVMPMRKKMFKCFTDMTFSQVNLVSLVKTSISAEDFERLIVKTINSGNRATMKLKKDNLTNRLAAQPVGRHNQIHSLSTLRQVSVLSSSVDSAKQSGRAAEMRRVHMSAIGYICCVHSTPEGEKVGINKQLSIFATVAPASNSEVLKNIIKQDNELFILANLKHIDIAKNNLARIFVNGDWIGCVKNSYDFATKYRLLRRKLIIHPHTTIYWDNTQNEVLFWVDLGRITRPLMIVYNNQRDKNALSSKFKITNEFEQGIAITQDDINALYQKKKTIDDLVREQKVEFITPEEQENYYLCPSYEKLKEDKNNPLKEYTHCDIPESILSITALTSPYANHNQTTRLIYQTSQVKQTCGYYALNWPYRMDKETFLQYINEQPLVKTVANKYLFPSGSNVIVGLMCSAWNQEDSLVLNKAAVERGAFNGSRFTFYKVELEQKEELGNPDASKTSDLKSANYEKLVNGVIPKGTIVKTDDVIIGKYMAIQKGKNDKFSYIDRSVVYRENEDAIVNECIIDRNEDDQIFCKIALRKIRQVNVGDKFCIRENAEILTNEGFIKLKDIDITKHKIATNDNSNLKYVYSSNKYMFDYNSETEGKLIQIKNKNIDTVVTKQHKLYINIDNEYKFITGEELINYISENKDKDNIKIQFKKNINNTSNINNKVDLFNYLNVQINNVINYGIKNNINNEFKDNENKYNENKDNKINHDIVNEINHETKDKLNNQNEKIDIFKQYIQNKKLPIYTWLYSSNYCLNLLYILIHSRYMKNIMIENNNNLALSLNILNNQKNNDLIKLENYKQNYNNKNTNNNDNNKNNDIIEIYDDEINILNELQQLIFHIGISSDIYNNENQSQSETKDKNNTTNQNNHNNQNTNQNTKYKLVINLSKNNNEPILSNKNIQYVDYNGKVGCLEIPETHLFYYRESETSPALWTGNSSRQGQKGICALLMREEDMPFTTTGIRPAVLFNSHGLPSRMTIATYLEMLMGNLCAMKGTNADCTIFRKTNIEVIANELEQLGLHRYGYEKLIHGITGEYIDSLIFFGPTYYQRLQKFVADAEYSVRHAASDPITNQPIDGGRGSGGGLRIGEMEKDVLASHGTMSLFNEKFYSHSDGYTEYICRCGKPAIVNHQDKIYKCNYCKDNADITAIPTSWSSKLFMQEIMSSNIGVRRIPKPFTYEVYDTKNLDHSKIEPYDKKVLKQLQLMNEASNVINAEEKQEIQIQHLLE
jgi:DNA-directed RNA polymerase beta subunit